MQVNFGDVLDLTPPVTTAQLDPAVPNGKSDWYVSDVEVSLSASDVGSGVAQTLYRINGGLFLPWQTYSAPFVVGAESNDHLVEFYSTDNAGNLEPVQHVNFKLDKTPPSTLMRRIPELPNGSNGWYTSDVTVHLLALDPVLADGGAGSGRAATYYRVNAAAWQPYAAPIVVSGEGAGTVMDYYSTDVAGNTEVANSYSIKLDKTAPVLSCQVEPAVITRPNRRFVGTGGSHRRGRVGGQRRAPAVSLHAGVVAHHRAGATEDRCHAQGG
jgi:hypothetical protein